MKFQESQFEDYVRAVQERNFHARLERLWAALPEDVHQMPNLLLHGPNGVGKYSQALHAIHRYSPSGLKYEKRIFVPTVKKLTSAVRLSDIHFEVDFSILGRNAKTAWHAIYQHILAVISTRRNRCGIIVCREFHTIRAELLDVMYSYMQQYNSGDIVVRWVILTDEYSFLPEELVQRFSTIAITRPKAVDLRWKQSAAEEHFLRGEYEQLDAVTNVQTGNIKTIHLKVPDPTYFISLRIVQLIMTAHQSFPYEMREALYDILLYQLDVHACVRSILTQCIQQEALTIKGAGVIIQQLYLFFKFYNNNYHPIYHLERIIICIMRAIIEEKKEKEEKEEKKEKKEEKVCADENGIENVS